MTQAAIPWILGTKAAVDVVGQRKSRKQAEEEAAKQREALAALQAEEPPAIPGEAEAKRGRRRSIRDLLLRRGRRSTILTNQSEGDALGA